jgi:hypothetical protein
MAMCGPLLGDKPSATIRVAANGRGVGVAGPKRGGRIGGREGSVELGDCGGDPVGRGLVSGQQPAAKRHDRGGRGKQPLLKGRWLAREHGYIMRNRPSI